jgi:hypothetical protein
MAEAACHKQGDAHIAGADKPLHRSHKYVPQPGRLRPRVAHYLSIRILHRVENHLARIRVVHGNRHKEREYGNYYQRDENYYVRAGHLKFLFLLCYFHFSLLSLTPLRQGA